MEAWEIAANQLLTEMAAGDWTKENIIAEISNRASNFSAELDSGKTYVFFSEMAAEAELLVDNNANAGRIQDTAAGAFIDKIFNSDELKSIHFFPIDSERTSVMQHQIGSPVDQVSARYADHASGRVILLSNDARINIGDASDSSILYRTELPRLLNDPDVTHINGVDKAFIKILGLGNAEIILRSLEKSFAETLTKISIGAGEINVDTLNNSSSDLASKFNQGMIVMSAYIDRVTKIAGKTIENVKAAIPSFNWDEAVDDLHKIFTDSGETLQSLANKLALPLAGAELLLTVNSLAEAYELDGVEGFLEEAKTQILIWGTGIVVITAGVIFAPEIAAIAISSFVVVGAVDIVHKLVTGELQEAFIEFGGNLSTIIDAIKASLQEGVNNLETALTEPFELTEPSLAPDGLTDLNLGTDNILRGGIVADSFDLNDPLLADYRTVFGDGGNDELTAGELQVAMYGGKGDDVIRGGDGDDFLIGDDLDLEYKTSPQTNEYGNDTIYGGKGHDQIYGGLGDDILEGGEGDDLIIGSFGADTIKGDAGNDKIIAGAGDDQIDGGDGYDYALIRSGSEIVDEQVVLSKSGADLVIEGAENSIASTSGTNKSGELDYGLDHYTSIERIVLTSNPDDLTIFKSALDLDLSVDMAKSRRTQSELADGETLDDDAFIRNVDIADYSKLDIGISYLKGQTSEREQGILHSGSSIHNIGDPWFKEVALVNGTDKDAHKLIVQGADKIILTNKDDVFIGAKRSTIVDLGEGQDKVWLRPDILVEGFDNDDRLTLYGVLNLYGGKRNSESELPWAEGWYGIRYAINPAGDLVVNNPWLKTADGREQNMFIANWRNQEGKADAILDAGQYGVGPGDIALAEFSFRSSTLNDLIKGNNPPAGDGESIGGLWALLRFQLRTLTGSNLFPESSDPLILDLDGDGFGLEWRNGYSPDFDIDLDLFAEETATLDRDDGFLARDINGDGVINDAGELFGHGNVLGFSVLAGLDGNQDGLVNNLDDGLADFNGDGIIDGTDQFGNLLIWRDINGDMISQANELGTVGDHDITSFALPANWRNEEDKADAIFNAGQYRVSPDYMFSFADQRVETPANGNVLGISCLGKAA